MKKLLIAALAAAAILPSAAMARPADTRVVVVDHDRGFGHRGPVGVKRITVGSRVEPGFIARHDVVQHPRRYHLAKTNANTRWLKVRDDAVLVNLRSGRVLDVAYNLFR
ncbi:MAG: RcnB family protein [Sphingobium sp.]|nr:RcnB family protein [Sphingobium sp.]